MVALVSIAAPSAMGVVPTASRRTVAPPVVTPTVSGHYQPFTGDFDGNGYADVFWYAPGPAPDYIWYFTGRNRHTQRPVTVNGNYTPIVADFNTDRADDILWYVPGPAPDFLWLGRADHAFATRPYVADGNFRPVAGDFDGDGFADILWYAPGPAPDYLWSGTSSGRFAWTGVKLDGDYTPYAGDFDANRHTDVLFHSVSGDDVTAFGTTARTFSFHTLTAPAATVPIIGAYRRQCCAPAQYASDILWYAPGAAVDQAWYATSRHLTYQHVVANFTSVGYRALPADFDGDGKSDIFWYAPGTPSESIWYDVSEQFAATVGPRWVRDLGTPASDGATAVAVARSGNVVIAGAQNGPVPDARPHMFAPGSTTPSVPQNFDVLLAEFDANGQQRWRVTLASPADDFTNAMALDAAGNVYVTGSTDGVLAGAVEHRSGLFVAKFDAAGHRLWVHQHPGLTGAGIAVDLAGNVYVAGPPTTGTGVGTILVKYNTLGHEQWIERDASIARNGCLGSNGVAVDFAGNFYVSGSAAGLLPDDVGAVVAKYDTSGRQLWRRRFGGKVVGSGACGIAVTAGGEVSVTGSAYGKVPEAPEAAAGSSDVFVARLDTNGALAWVHALGASGVQDGIGVASDDHGDVWVTGRSAGGGVAGATGEGNVLLAKYRSDGLRLAVHQFGSSSMAEGLGIAVDNDLQRAYIAGASLGQWWGSPDPYLGDFDAFVLQY